MNLVRKILSSDWNAGSYNNGSTRLDGQVNLDAYNHPAVVPNLDITSTDSGSGAALYGAATGGAQVTGFTTPTVSASGDLYANDQFVISRKSGSYLEFTSTANQVTIYLAGILTAGMHAQVGPSRLRVSEIRNGAVVDILVDGTLITSVDTYKATPVVQIETGGGSHSIKIEHSGGYSSSFNPVGPVTPDVTVGSQNTVAQTLVVTPQFHPTLTPSSWRVLATASNQYSLYQTPQGGTESLVVSGLLAGQIYSGYIPGCDLTVNTNVPLTTNDSATFTTDVTTLAIQSVTLGFGTNNGAGTYTSEVIDSGAPDTAWVLAEWEENNQMAAFTLSVGNTPTPDGTWSTFTVTPQDYTLPSGTQMGVAGLIPDGPPVGQYAQWTINMPEVAAKQVYIRNFYLYYWSPQRDPNLVGKLALAKNWTMGPIMHAFMASLGISLARCQQDAIDYVDSFAISGALDQYLYAYAADFGIEPYTAMPPQALRQFLLATLQSKGQGGSLPFAVEQVALLVTGSLGNGEQQTGTSGALTVTCNGVTAQQIANQGVSWSIPAVPYNGLPGIDTPTARTIITAFITGFLTPANCVVSPNNTGSNITFN